MKCIFLGGIIESTADIIVESIYAHHDVDKNEYLLLQGFTDQRKNGLALSIENQKQLSKAKKLSESQQLDGTFVANGRIVQYHERNYPTMKSCIESRVFKYVIAQGIQYGPTFNWWVHHVLKKKDRIISMMTW